MNSKGYMKEYLRREEKTKDRFNNFIVKLVDKNGTKQYDNTIWDNAAYVQSYRPDDTEMYFICYNSANLLSILHQLKKTYIITFLEKGIEVVINE